MRGYPDVDYMVAGVAGKVELKVAKVVRGTIRLPHYTVEQHQFALRWTAAGGLCDLLLQAAGVYYWLPGGAAAQAMSPAQAAGQALWWDTGRHVSLAVPLGIRVGGTVKPA